MFSVNLFLIISMMFLVYAQQSAKNTENYGPYIMEFPDHAPCKGTKPNNISAMTTSLDENLVGVVNFTFYTDIKMDSVKIHVKDGKKNSLWNYKANEPCKHVAYSFFIKHYLKTDNSCVVKAGFYSITLNFRDVMYTVLGNSFFYGKYYTKTDVMSKNKQIACFVTTFVIKKKT